jgi:hypothetical protein
MGSEPQRHVVFLQPLATAGVSTLRRFLMRHPWFVPALLALAALGGYAAGARPVSAQPVSAQPLSAQPASAQPDVVPVRVGQTVELGFDASHGRRCFVEEMKGTFVRCRNLSKSDRASRWLNLTQVEWLTTGVLPPEGSDRPRP